MLENTEEMLYSENRFDLDKLLKIDDPAQFVQQLLNQGFPRNALMQQLLRNHIPMPQELIDEGVSERDFYNNLENFSGYLAALDFDPVAFVADLEERIIQPLKDMQQAIDDNPYVTRIFTTVSPDELTLVYVTYNQEVPLGRPANHLKGSDVLGGRQCTCAN